MKISDLRPNPENPRTISKEKLAQLKKALIEFGDLSGIVYNRKTKQLCGGHQRLKHLDPDAPITIIKKYSKPSRTGTLAEGFVELKGERFSYREVSWSDDKERAANLAANKGAGEFDMPKVGEWLKDLESKMDLNLTMFDEDELKKIAGIAIAAHTRSEATGIDEDEIPEKAPARTKLGDLYILGRHRLLCGDATDAKAVSALVGQERADMVFTDPPYGVNYDGGHATEKRREKLKNDQSPDIYSKVLPLLYALTKDKAAIYLYFSDSKSASVIASVIASGYQIRNTLIWNKNMAQFGAIGAQYKSKHEPCIYAFKKGHAPFWNGPNNEVSVWDMKREPKNEFHPTQKPVELSERALTNSCPENGFVLDLFGGSGSTLIACEKTNRKCLMMELDPHYCDVIVERWEKYTGQKAKLLTQVKTKTKRRTGKNKGLLPIKTERA